MRARLQTFNGAVACQMLDRLHPGVLLLQRVDFNSKEQYYSEQNWRLLQQAFKKVGIDYVRLLRLSSPSPQ